MPTLLKNPARQEVQTGVVTVTQVKDEALLLWGDLDAADRFLNRPHPLLGGREPLAVAQQSRDGAAEVKKLIDAARAGVAV